MSSYIIAVERVSYVEDLTSNSWRVLAGSATLIVYVIAFSYFGLLIPTVLLVFVWLKWLGREGWFVSTVVSIILSVVIFLLFAIVLKVPFPYDVIGNLVTGEIAPLLP